MPMTPRSVTTWGQLRARYSRSPCGCSQGAEPAPEIAGAAGLAYGLSRALGRLPALWHNGGFPVSAERLAVNGVTPQMLAARPFTPLVRKGVGAARAGLEEMARTALAEVRAAGPQIGPGGNAALLPLAMVEPYFALQKRVGAQLLEVMVEVRPLARAWHIGRCHLLQRL